MAKVAIVYHSGYGHTKVQAEAVARGAASVDGTEVSLHPAEDFQGPGEDFDHAIAVNAEAAGLLMEHCRGARAVLVAATCEITASMPCPCSVAPVET